MNRYRLHNQGRIASALAALCAALTFLLAPPHASRADPAAPAAPIPETAPLNIQVSRSSAVPGASRPVTDFSEVMLAIDPTDPNHLLGTSKFFFDAAAYKHYTGVLESFDAGMTWTQRQPDGLEVYAKTSDPVTTFDELGNGYFTLLTVRPLGVDMLKKPAGGDWGAPVTVDRTTHADKQWITGDQDPKGSSPYAGNLSLTWADVTIDNQMTYSAEQQANIVRDWYDAGRPNSGPLWPYIRDHIRQP